MVSGQVWFSVSLRTLWLDTWIRWSECVACYQSSAFLTYRDVLLNLKFTVRAAAQVCFYLLWQTWCRVLYFTSAAWEWSHQANQACWTWKLRWQEETDRYLSAVRWDELNMKQECKQTSGQRREKPCTNEHTHTQPHTQVFPVPRAPDARWWFKRDHGIQC